MSVRTAAALASALAAIAPTAAYAAQDGWIDPTFGQAGRQIVAFDRGFDNWDQVRGIAVLPDDRILLAGYVENDPSQVGIGLARLNANGTVDESFGKPWHLPESLENADTIDAALQDDGKLVIVGHGHDGSAQHGLVCRFLPDGNPDPDFATIDNPLSSGCRLIAVDEAIVVTLTTVAVQADGRLALAGWVHLPDGTHGLVLRLDAQGNFDDSFSDGGTHVLLPESVHPTVVQDIAQTPDGDLVAVGVASVNENVGWQVFRLSGADGELDVDFDGDGLKPVNFDLVPGGADFASRVFVLPNGSILVGGTAGVQDNGNCPAIVRLTPTGQFDDVLDGDGQYVDDFCAEDMQVRDMLVQTDSRIVLSGEVSDDFMALRITPDGQRDTSFGFNGLSTIEMGPAHGMPLANDGAYRIASQGGRLLLAGYTDPGDDGQRDFAITRLETDLIFADDLE